MKSRAENLLAVANLSLGLLGEPPCTAWTPPDSKAGEKLSVFLPVAIDEAQSCFYWQELISHKVLSALPEAHYDGRYRFSLPDDCLRPMRIRMETGAEPLPETIFSRALECDQDYEIEGGLLLSHLEGVRLVYVRRSDEPAQWSAELLRCIYHLTAVNAGQSITQDSGITRNVLEKYETLVKPYAKLLQSRYKTNKPRYI